MNKHLEILTKMHWHDALGGLKKSLKIMQAAEAIAKADADAATEKLITVTEAIDSCKTEDELNELRSQKRIAEFESNLFNYRHSLLRGKSTGYAAAIADIKRLSKDFGRTLGIELETEANAIAERELNELLEDLKVERKTLITDTICASDEFKAGKVEGMETATIFVEARLAALKNGGKTQ